MSSGIRPSAVAESHRALEALRAEQGPARPITPEDLQHQLRFLHARLLSEGGLYAPATVGLALKQALGDPAGAARLLRRELGQRPRLAPLEPHDTRALRHIRRISGFRDCPREQWLGPCLDGGAPLRAELSEESPRNFAAIHAHWLQDLPDLSLGAVDELGVSELLQLRGLLVPDRGEGRDGWLATLAGADTGALIGRAGALLTDFPKAPRLAELRVGRLALRLPHPVSGEPMEAGECELTEAELLLPVEDGFYLGYGACFGHNELKALAIAVLDLQRQYGLGDVNGVPDAGAAAERLAALAAPGRESLAALLQREPASAA